MQQSGVAASERAVRSRRLYGRLGDAARFLIADIPNFCDIDHMKLLSPLRSAIDREWVRVDWSGSQTVRHRVIAAAPLMLVVVSTLLPVPRAVQFIALLAGLCLSITVTMWIEARRWVGAGAFSTRRSENFVRRLRAKRQRQDQAD